MKKLINLILSATIILSAFTFASEYQPDTNTHTGKFYGYRVEQFDGSMVELLTLRAEDGELYDFYYHVESMEELHKLYEIRWVFEFDSTGEVDFMEVIY